MLQVVLKQYIDYVLPRPMNIENVILVATRETFLNKIQAQNTKGESCLVPILNVRGSKIYGIVWILL